jgi:hypothetical protein
MSHVNLNRLALDAWELHAAAAQRPWLVDPSAPVLFFGDHRAYLASQLRIATVALNPSRQEFPVASPFSRFPRGEVADITSYLTGLGAYFRTDPYIQWFDFYEQALSGLGASYYSGKPSTALHTDIGSVLPTNPTWSGLDNRVREYLKGSGVTLWHSLIAYLEPEILLWSTARFWLDLINLTPLSAWNVLHTFHKTKAGNPRKRPIAICARWYQLPTDARVLIAFVPAAQKPLAALSHSQKWEAGIAILKSWREGIERP